MDDLQEMVTALTDGLIEHSLEIGRLLHEQIPELGDDPATFEITRASAEANLGAVLTILRTEVALEDVEAPLAAIEFARQLVRRGIALEPLLRAYRLGTSWIWEVWTRELNRRVADADRRAALLERCMAVSFTYMDRVSACVIEEYGAEYERWVRTAAAVRDDTTRKIIDGANVDVDAAGARLGYALRGRQHLGLILWGDEREGAVDDLEEAAAALAASVPDSSLLLVTPTPGTLWAWVGAFGQIDDEAVERATAGAPQLDVVRIAAGAPGHGVQGFRRSHIEAVHARRVALLEPERRGGLLRYRSVTVPSLLSTDLDSARTFVLAELGPLALPAHERLRTTLDVFLEEGGRAVAAALRLDVHQNTVSYRVRRAEEIRGRPIGDRRFELEVALRLARTLGPRVLEHGAGGDAGTRA